MQRQIDHQIQAMKDHLIEMGGLVERAIDEATQALVERSALRLERVHALEASINPLHKRVDQLAVSLLAKQSPLAQDLRWIVAGIKMSTDLERMGDQAVNIAYAARDYLSGPPVKELTDLPKMSQLSRGMVRESLDAFVSQDAVRARVVLTQDDEVDALKLQVTRDVILEIKSRPEILEQGLALISIAKNLERIADHATNIAEDVIFSATGADVRHGGESK
jgi:phosphate transport system protein